jgi:hypothetical protein
LGFLIFRNKRILPDVFRCSEVRKTLPELPPSCENPLLIPNDAHFVWLGPGFSFVHLLAVASAVRSGGFERVIVHHTDALDDVPAFRDAVALERVSTERLMPEALLELAGAGELVDTYRSLDSPASRSNLVRIALLHERGGVYLDTDTVTVRSFDALTARGGAFVGEERLVFPGKAGGPITARLNPVALLRTAARDVLRRVPEGYRGFRHVAALYPKAANNAVIGAEAEHPLLSDLLARAVALPPSKRRIRYALGTHLLQEAVEGYRGADLGVLPPAAFFPLGPEISEHWFRVRPSVDLADIIEPDTVLVHWYASVRTKPHVAHLAPAFVRRHAATQLFSALALPVVDALESGELRRKSG